MLELQFKLATDNLSQSESLNQQLKEQNLKYEENIKRLEHELELSEEKYRK